VNSPGRLPILDGLRAISILLVLAAHMLPLGPKVIALNSTAGAMGMSLFFALSGFLIASTLIHNADIREFLVRRLTRIVPLAYALPCWSSWSCRSIQWPCSSPQPSS
jgi:peptidoglycan/LPS O-acetylase OafA/YrhL